MTRVATGQPEKRVVTHYTPTAWGLDCVDCGAVLLRDLYPVDTTLWVHVLQAHECNDYYYSIADRERHALSCDQHGGVLSQSTIALSIAAGILCSSGVE